MAHSSNTALLVMDVQTGIVERFAKTGDLLEQIQKAIGVSRLAHIPVIYVAVKFRPGFPEVSPQNKSFSGIKERSAAFQESSSSTELHPALAPLSTESIVTKRRVSAFTGSDLEVLLRAQGITHLVLCGIATSGVVLSTLREAADKDYRLTVLSDCCADGDEEVHRVLLSKIFPRQADVLTVEEWSAEVKS